MASFWRVNNNNNNNNKNNLSIKEPSLLESDDDHAYPQSSTLLNSDGEDHGRQSRGQTADRLETGMDRGRQEVQTTTRGYSTVDTTTTISSSSSSTWSGIGCINDCFRHSLPEQEFLHTTTLHCRHKQDMGQYDASAACLPKRSSRCCSEVVEILLNHGAFFIGAVLATLGACLELSIAWKHRHDPVLEPAQAAVGATNTTTTTTTTTIDDDIDNEWVYKYHLIFHWDVLETLSVTSTLMYFVSFFAHLYYEHITTCLDWLRILCFGVGAMLDLLSSLCYSEEDDPTDKEDNTRRTLLTLSKDAYVFGNMSCDLFLLSAIFVILANRQHYQQSCVLAYAFLLLTADLLFFLGVSIDAVVSRLDTDDESNHRWVMLCICGLVSAVCWLSNSILGAVADLFFLDPHDDDDDDDHHNNKNKAVASFGTDMVALSSTFDGSIKTTTETISSSIEGMMEEEDRSSDSISGIEISRLCN